MPPKRDDGGRSRIWLRLPLYEKWNKLRTSLSKSHDELASFLIEFYSKNTTPCDDPMDIPPRLTPIKNTFSEYPSTPTGDTVGHRAGASNAVASTPMATTYSTAVSGIFSLGQSNISDGEMNDSKCETTLPYDDQESVRVHDSMVLFDTLDETICDEDDDTYIPSSSASSGSDSDSDSDDNVDVVLAPSIENLTNVESPNDVEENDDEISDDEDIEISYDKKDNHPLLVFKKCLLDLANRVPPEKCTSCSVDIINIRESIKGSGLSLTWTCVYGHVVSVWHSQPKVRQGNYIADISLSSAVILSGNNMWKIKLFCKFLQLPIISERSHYRYQSRFINPIINSTWQQVLKNNFDKTKNKDTMLLGDGRMDSPGFCAKFCTYVGMDGDSLDIIALEIIDKRQVGLKSTSMEIKGLVDSITNLSKANVRIKEVVTDAHSQIIKYMREKHPDKVHSNDVWHGAKNLAKRLTKAAKKAENRDINPWIRDIITHFWYCVKVCSTQKEFVAKWKGVLHHVTGVHTWILGEGYSNTCDHGELVEDDEKPVIRKDSPSHRTLKRVIWDEKFLKTIPRLLPFRSTATIENFNDLVLMYASKRIAYRYHAYKARNQLAALDYTHHKDRAVKKNKKGEICWQRKYNKNSKRWTVYQKKVPKQYTYIPQIMEEIVNAYNSNKVFTPAFQPKLISPTIAPVPPTDTKTLVAEHKSRFDKN